MTEKTPDAFIDPHTIPAVVQETPDLAGARLSPVRSELSAAFVKLPMFNALGAEGAIRFLSDRRIAGDVDLGTLARTGSGVVPAGSVAGLVTAGAGMIDNQVDSVREIARRYPALQALTHLPDSLDTTRPTKVFDEVRSLAMAYMLNEVVVRTVHEEAAGDSQKQKLLIPGTVVSPYVGIPIMEFDPMELAA